MVIGLKIKYHISLLYQQLTTIQFIAQNTSIPVPKIHCSFKRGEDTYIVMQRIDGLMLGHQWARRSEDSKSRILHQLKTMVEEMRSIPRPNNIGVESVDGGTLWDCRLPSPLERFGPFKTIQEFHRYLRNGVETSPDNKLEVNELIALHNRIWPVPCFTHGDLSSLNVLARGDNVVGIIDWETAGWYPHYWEYATACNVNPRNLFWRNEIERFLESFPQELAMDRLRDKYFGDIP